MLEKVINFLKGISKKEKQDGTGTSSKDTAKERLHLVLMQDRANVSADFLELMKQEIIDVIKKYIEVDESAIDVRLTNKANEDGTTGAPALYANIPIMNIKHEMGKEPVNEENEKEQENKEEKVTEPKEEIMEEIKEEKELTKEEIKEEEIEETEKVEKIEKNKDQAEVNKEVQKGKIEKEKEEDTVVESTSKD